MGLVKDNLIGYDNSITKAAGKLHGSLLLAHGTSDDNVHLQNSIQMIDAFIKRGQAVSVDALSEQDPRHRRQCPRSHLFHMMQDHWDGELK